MADRRRHYRIDELAHGRTTGPVYYLGPDDQWVLGELTVNEQWLTFDGITENISHPLPSIACVNALDFFNYFESYCFELVCVPQASAIAALESKAHRSRAPSRQQIQINSQSNINSFAGPGDSSNALSVMRGPSPGTSMVEQFTSPGRAERDRGVDTKGERANNSISSGNPLAVVPSSVVSNGASGGDGKSNNNLHSPSGHSHMSPNNANVSMMTVFPTSPDATGAGGGGGGGLSTNGVPMLPLANLTSNNGRQSPINPTAAVRNGDSLSVTPVLSPATSFQDGVKGFLASGAGGRDYEHTLTVNGQLASNNTIATPTVGSYPSFQIPSNVPLERVVFKALSMGDYMAWLSVFDQYLDLAVLNKCGMVIPNVVVEPSDEFGHLYKTFAAYGERLPDPNPALIQEDMGLNF